MKIEKVLIKQEQLVCRAEKNTKLLLCMLLIFPLDLIGVPFQYRLINAFTTGNVVSHTGVDLAISATIFLFGWSLPLLVIMMYISTELIITNKRVFIRNGISGTLTIIPLDSIAGIENCDTVSSFLSLYYLSVHLLDGKKICSATCFSKNGLKDVEKALADKSINKFDFFKMK
ncbi:MAG: hypothetical protein KBI01_09455, partial [Oscillospiraceae bacterium]|nr:hypothetical protein [Oscillospiraceae bacterium]